MLLTLITGTVGPLPIYKNWPTLIRSTLVGMWSRISTKISSNSCLCARLCVSVHRMWQVWMFWLQTLLAPASIFIIPNPQTLHWPSLYPQDFPYPLYKTLSARTLYPLILSPNTYVITSHLRLYQLFYCAWADEEYICRCFAVWYVRNLSSVQDREICCYSISCKEQHNIGTSQIVLYRLFLSEMSLHKLTPWLG